MLARVAAVSLGVLVAVLPLVAGAAGYYAGSTRTSSPVWTDREFVTLNVNPSAPVIAFVSTMRCTYHLADGSVRRVDSPVVVRASLTGGESAADSRVCPPPP